jgi:DNA/RNA endonuclease G (NUC1)
MQKPEPPDPEQFPPDIIDLPGWRPVVGDELMFVMWSAVVLAMLAAMFSICEPVCGDELVPVPDPLFQEVATVATRSVFGDRFPETTNRQVLVQRHLYLACVDIEAKQPAWVAFRVRKQDWDTDNKLERNFSTPSELRDICLEPGDYNKSGYEKGHLYALQLAGGSQYGHEVNQLCAVAAQRPGLNKGPWLDAENRIKKASETGTVSVLSGQLWLSDMPPLKRANEPHKVASHCWIMWSTAGVEESYLMPQSATTKDELEQFKIDPQELREKVSRSWVGRQ